MVQLTLRFRRFFLDIFFLRRLLLRGSEQVLEGVYDCLRLLFRFLEKRFCKNKHELQCQGFALLFMAFLWQDDAFGNILMFSPDRMVLKTSAMFLLLT